jgi:uncharacterized protein YbjT (DUF2867 family)
LSRIAIIGATTKLGKELVTVCIKRDCQAHALVSDARTITRQHENVTTFEVDLRTGRGLAAALSGCRFVVWAFATRRPIVADSVKRLLGELKARGTLKRFVFVSQPGASASRPPPPLFWGFLQRAIPAFPGGVIADLSRAEAALRGSQVPFVILRPRAFAQARYPQPGNGVVAVGARDAPPGPITRTELAEFIIGMLEEDGRDRGEFVVGTADRPLDPFSFEQEPVDSESVMKELSSIEGAALGAAKPSGESPDGEGSE